MPELPNADPADLGAFLREAGFHVERATGEEVTGHVEATAEHHTPWGRVHGGLYTTVVESACSIGASAAVLNDGPPTRFAVGLTNTTEFLRAHVEGRLDVRAWPIHQSRTGQLWQCDLTRADGKLVAQGRVPLQNVELR
jgi:1,4-dihydroxy-2-naphthoyl-CoA hydrolase